MMNARTLLLIGLMTLALIGCSDDDDDSHITSLEPNQTERALAVLESIESGDSTDFTAFISANTYTQHNLSFPDGSVAVAGADFTGIAQIAAGIPEGTPFYSSLEYLYADHDFVLTMSEGFPDADTGLSDAYFDLFRVADGQIVEHWDIIQSIPDESTWANENGKW